MAKRRSKAAKRTKKARKKATSRAGRGTARARSAKASRSRGTKATAKKRASNKAGKSAKKGASGHVKKKATKKAGTRAKKSTSRKKTAKKAATPKAGSRKSVKKASSARKTGSRKASAKAAGKPATPTPATSPDKSAGTAPTQSPRPAVRGSGLRSNEIERLRRLLLEKRAEILGDVTTLHDEAFSRNRADRGGDLSNMPIHMADLGTDNYEQEFTLGLLESERAILHEIDEALQRIENGTYGICAATGQPIGKARLLATPWTKYCYDYVLAQEKRQGRRY